MADERRTLVDALMEIGTARITPAERRRRFSRLLYNLRADRIDRRGSRPGRTWLHHPEYGDLLLKDEDWNRKPANAERQPEAAI